MADQNNSLLPPPVRTVLRQTSKALAHLAPTESIVLPTADFLIVQMFMRSAGLFDAIALLLESSFGEEAMILGRSLFEDSLRLAQLADAGEQRAALLIGMEQASINDKEALIRQAAKLGLERDRAAELQQLEEQRTKLQGYAQRHGISRAKPFLAVPEAAQRYGREKDEFAFLMGHRMVHGTDAGVMFRREQVDKTMRLFDRTPDPRFLVDAACFAVRSAVQVATASASILNWPMKVQLAELVRQIEALENKLA